MKKITFNYDFTRFPFSYPMSLKVVVTDIGAQSDVQDFNIVSATGTADVYVPDTFTAPMSVSFRHMNPITGAWQPLLNITDTGWTVLTGTAPIVASFIGYKIGLR